MGLGLERIAKTGIFRRACIAGLAALTLTASFYIGTGLVTSVYMRTKVLHDVYLNYVTTDAINEQVSDFLGNDTLLENAHNTDYSTLDLVEEESQLVHMALEQDAEDSVKQMDPFADKDELACAEYTFLTYKGLVSLVKEHPELKPHLKNVRIVTGILSNERSEEGHAWLEVKVDDEWQIYDPRMPFLNQPEWRDRVEYYPWAHFSMRDNGSIEKTIYPLNIFTHPFDATKYVFNILEDRLDRETLI